MNAATVAVASLIALCLRAPEATAQTPASGPGDVLVWAAGPPAAGSVRVFRGDDRSDPGYALYKEGYALILEEKYTDARKKFQALLAKYPHSSYADDARYWTAYSYRNLDAQKAIAEYERFLRDYPKSQYLDDAVADIAAIRANRAAAATAPAAAVAPVAPFAAVPPFAAVAPTPANMENMMRNLRRQMRQIGRTGFPGMVHPVGTPAPDEEHLDEATRIKMDALYALGETREDDKSFATLRDVALDPKAVHPLREAAMDALSGFTQHDVMSIFVDIVRQDTSADIQGYAIDYIGEHGTDRNQRVSVLASLYGSVPKTRYEQRKEIVYTIASIGNDRAVEFLKGVALRDEDFECRRDAVYYLGSIGGESARAALYDILRGH
ncbi:MAG TPA: outer membrane protein assembly factor BamD [Bacteroidota bacterium]|nr:outer membrane protein assembly factor BamD [Bacteroidota bacterium]